MSGLGLALRWLHLAASVGLVGGAVMLLIAGRSDRPTALAWQSRVTGAARWLLLFAVGRLRTTERIDWIALHGETAGLALIALALASASGHAAAAEPSVVRAI